MAAFSGGTSSSSSSHAKLLVLLVILNGCLDGRRQAATVKDVYVCMYQARGDTTYTHAPPALLVNNAPHQRTSSHVAHTACCLLLCCLLLCCLLLCCFAASTYCCCFLLLTAAHTCPSCHLLHTTLRTLPATATTLPRHHMPCCVFAPHACMPRPLPPSRLPRSTSLPTAPCYTLYVVLFLPFALPIFLLYYVFTSHHFTFPTIFYNLILLFYFIYFYSPI